ncbi:MAG TPA: sigma-70 family RNA polymerase sigma factor [Solirubrobacteraceae bacterium]|nr:sigma-70 family RNA polymerase sigma factor [Solirubrobacteraceae bacterium]
MEVSALKYSGGIGLHGRSPLLRLQSDERLIGFLRRGNMGAFEVLVSRYENRLMAFCRHLLGSREDAEDVLQEVLTAAFNAILADDRPINVRPWLYRIARNRSLNHLRRIQAIGVDSMDHHLSEHGASTADKVHEREEFRLLVGDIHELPETQKTALVLREMDAMAYEQIAEAMETTVPSVKSLLVRARVSLAEAAEARVLSCDEVRIELAEVAEGLQRRPSPLVRRHVRTCTRCSEFRSQLKATNKALAALLPVGPLAMLHKLLFIHLSHSAGAGSGAAGAGSTAGAAGAAGAGAGAMGAGAAGAGAGFGAAGAGGTLVAGSSALAGSSGFVSAGIGAFAGKAAAGLAAAALVTAGAVEVDHGGHHHPPAHPVAQAPGPVAAPHAAVPEAYAPTAPPAGETSSSTIARSVPGRATQRPDAKLTTAQTTNGVKAANARTNSKTPATPAAQSPTTATSPSATPKVPAGRSQTQSDPTVLPTSTSSPAAPGTTSTSTGGAPLDPYPAQTAQTGTGSSPTGSSASTTAGQPSSSTSTPSGGSTQTGTSTSTGTTPTAGSTPPLGATPPPATGPGDGQPAGTGQTTTTTPSPTDPSPSPSPSPLPGAPDPLRSAGQL